jgi:hypothetical protein
MRLSEVAARAWVGSRTEIFAAILLLREIVTAVEDKIAVVVSVCNGKGGHQVEQGLGHIFVKHMMPWFLVLVCTMCHRYSLSQPALGYLSICLQMSLSFILSAYNQDPADEIILTAVTIPIPKDV